MSGHIFVNYKKVRYNFSEDRLKKIKKTLLLISQETINDTINVKKILKRLKCITHINKHESRN